MIQQPSTGYHSHSPRTKQMWWWFQLPLETVLRGRILRKSHWIIFPENVGVGRTLGYDKLGFATELDADGKSSKNTPKRWFDGDVSNRVYSIHNVKGIIQSIFYLVLFTQKHSQDGFIFFNYFHYKKNTRFIYNNPSPTPQNKNREIHNKTAFTKIMRI